jgi:hypothetical protein
MRRMRRERRRRGRRMRRRMEEHEVEDEAERADKEDKEEMEQKDDEMKMEKGYAEHIRRLDQLSRSQDQLIQQLLAAGCKNSVTRVMDVHVQTIMCHKHFTPEFRKQTDEWYMKQLLAKQAGNPTEFGSAGKPVLGETLANAHAAVFDTPSKSD